MWRLISNTTIASRSSTSLRIIGAIIAMALLLWTISYGYEAATESARYSLHGQLGSLIGALVMFVGFLLLALGLPIISDLFLELSEELQYPEGNNIGNLKEKADFFCLVLFKSFILSVLINYFRRCMGHSFEQEFPSKMIRKEHVAVV